MATEPHWPFYADSLLFQSPDPRMIPVPMFHKDGSFRNIPWTLTYNSLKKNDTKNSPKDLDQESQVSLRSKVLVLKSNTR